MRWKGGHGLLFGLEELVGESAIIMPICLPGGGGISETHGLNRVLLADSTRRLLQAKMEAGQKSLGKTGIWG